MISIENDIDLNLLSEHFVSYNDYTKEVILEELEYWRKNTDFLVVVYRDDKGIGGYLICYRNRNSLWIAQAWHRIDIPLEESRKGFVMAVQWAKEKGITSISTEMKRSGLRAMERYGMTEYSVNMRMEI